MPRLSAIEAITTRSKPFSKEPAEHSRQSVQFGTYVFTRSVMHKMLPRQIYLNVVNAMEGKEKIKEEYADPIAVAMKEWALELGATHYSHWFLPLTGASAEKHDAFIEWASPDQMIEQFTGKQLIQGEPDASSFPSGGLRSTYEARGYTGWDPTSPPFVWKEGNGVTLFIPSVFFSWTGDVLDHKIPLHRSEKKLSAATMRLLQHTGISASYVHTTLGLEQEYFVIDRSLRNLRPDLVMAGRTVFGAPSPKGQELQDHYFGSVKERILCFMDDFERAAIRLGIPVKTRHNEVAPAQHEAAPVVERGVLGIDHNIQLMELMRRIAERHQLAVLLHEKPFQGVNGSGKHCNWSLATDTGINLLDPTDTPENNLHFLVILTAVLHAVHRHSGLLRASIASASNDLRLGGHEAPPAIISAYLGVAIERLLEDIEKHGIHTSSKKSKYDLGLKEMPDLTKDYTDRNRTSPFAFTGNKFEFRALGSSANPSLSVTVLNAIVAESLNEILDEIESLLEEKKSKSRENFLEAATPVIRKYIKKSRPIRFSGDNYSPDWVKEATQRGLPIYHKAVDAFRALIEKSTFKAFEGILTSGELTSRFEILMEHYALTINIETNLMVEIFNTQVLPAAQKQLRQAADTINSMANALPKNALKEQKKELAVFAELIETAIVFKNKIEGAQRCALALTGTAQADAFCRSVTPLMDDFREAVDKIEPLTEDALWTLPKYRELFFMV